MLTEFANVARGRSDAQAFLTDGDGGIIDALHVNAMNIKEHVGCLLCDFGISNEDGDNVGWVRDHGDISLVESILDRSCVQLLQSTITLVFHLIFDGCLGASHSGWRKRSGKDKAWCERADCVDHLG